VPKIPQLDERIPRRKKDVGGAGQTGLDQERGRGCRRDFRGHGGFLRPRLQQDESRTSLTPAHNPTVSSVILQTTWIIGPRWDLGVQARQMYTETRTGGARRRGQRGGRSGHLRPKPSCVFRNSPNLLDNRTTMGPRGPGRTRQSKRWNESPMLTTALGSFKI